MCRRTLNYEPIVRVPNFSMQLEAMFESENLMHFKHFSRQLQTRSSNSNQLSREEILNGKHYNIYCFAVPI